MEQDRRLVYREFIRRAHDRPAGRWSSCHSRLSRRNCTGEHHHPHWTPERCELRVCPWCARRHAARLVNEFCDQMDALNKQGAFQRGRATNRPSFKLFTLTLKTPEWSDDSRTRVEQLQRALKELFDGWRKLQLLVGFERDKKERLFGAMAAAEIGERRNVHLHVVYWGRFVPQALLSERWHDITGTSYVVDIRELRGSWRDAVREVCKYVSKGVTKENWEQSRDQEPTVPELLLVDIFEALKGRRRVATYGLFYNVNVEADDEPRVCESCGAALSYVGTFEIEHIQAVELLAYLERFAVGPP